MIKPAIEEKSWVGQIGVSGKTQPAIDLGGNIIPQKASVGLPKQQPFKKQPILVIPNPRKNDGAIASRKGQGFILLIMKNIKAEIIASVIPPIIDNPARPIPPD